MGIGVMAGITRLCKPYFIGIPGDFLRFLHILAFIEMTAIEFFDIVESESDDITDERPEESVWTR